MTDKQVKAEKYLCTIILTAIMFFALADFWTWLEVVIFGEVRNNPVDNIISIPIIVSFWFNAKRIMNWAEEHSK